MAQEARLVIRWFMQHRIDWYLKREPIFVHNSAEKRKEHVSHLTWMFECEETAMTFQTAGRHGRLALGTIALTP